MKNFLTQALPGIIIATFLISAIIYAWTEPTSAPPSGNVAAPINVGSTPQTKAGSLGIGEDLIVGGRVGIGTTALNFPLTISKGGTGWDSFGRTKYPQLMVNANNQTGGGIAVSDDGGFFDWNDGYITYEPLCCGQGLKVNSNLTITNGSLCLSNGCRNSWPNINTAIPVYRCPNVGRYDCGGCPNMDISFNSTCPWWGDAGCNEMNIANCNFVGYLVQ